MKNKKIIVKDIGRTKFSYSWKYQERIFDEIIAQKVKNRASEKKSKTKNYIVLTEHDHVFTIGKSGNISNLLLDKNQVKQKGIDFHKINRGGDITYHGPGQIMCYPILDLDNFFTDINLYLRNLENTIIDTLDLYGIKGHTIKGETGVWVKRNKEFKKICAFGIRASRWVTMHGLSLNVKPDLDKFKYIIPCGISDKGVTSISEIKNETVNISELKLNLIKNFAKNFDAKIQKNNQLIS